MTIELVDGKAGTAHISSEDKAIIHQAKFGAGDMVFEWGDAMSCTMQSANKAVIGTGCASIQGLDWHITNPETVTIQSGSSGKNRNDIICAHYHRETSTGVEKVELVAFKGVPSDGAAVDPTIPSAKILNGAADAYMPLWRIPLTGITAGTPVRLFNKRYALWDSLTQPKHRNVLKSKTFDGMNVLAVRNLGAVTIWVAQVGSIRTTAEGVVIGTVEDDSRPAVPVRCLFGTNNGVWGIVCVDTGGNITLTHKFNDADVIWSFIDISFSYVIA
jgi:hypothetical protein